MHHVIANSRLVVFSTVLAIACGLPGLAGGAQLTGMISGSVKDGQGKPVEGATITIQLQEGITRRFTTKSRKDGTFTQIGLPAGRYKVTAEKTGVGIQDFTVSVQSGQSPQVQFQLIQGQSGAIDDDPKKAAALAAVFDAGVEAGRAGRHDEAIAKYREAIEMSPRCHQCYYNMGVALTQKKSYSEAEEAFRKAIDLKVDYAEAHRGLANVYNAQRKFDEAQAASKEAAKYSGGVAAVITGATQAEAIYSEAIILWNASKIAEAKEKLQEVIRLNPEHAEAHYWMGMANVNEGKLSEAATAFETYLKLAPDGQYAAQAKSVLAQVKK